MVFVSVAGIREMKCYHEVLSVCNDFCVARKGTGKGTICQYVLMIGGGPRLYNILVSTAFLTC